jgi:DNA-directed RNA polymerase specialized sigma24 family protein
MVLPAPAADDAPPPSERGWLGRIETALRLTRAGILILVDGAGPERLGALVRALLPEHPELEVHVDPRAAETVPAGSTFVLVPRATDADWLNIQRPVFARRRLRVILWCDRETSGALARHAVDFYDWISVYVDGPTGAPPHAVHGIRCALAARAPGVAWLGSDGAAVSEALAEALRGRGLVRIDPMGGYARMVEAIRGAGRSWIIAAAERPMLLWRVRWALAEAGRRTRAIVVTPGVVSSVGLRPPPALRGWWPVDDAILPVVEARRMLSEAGMSSPGRLAALAGLEPAALELMVRLIERGEEERGLISALLNAVDPGAILGSRALQAGLASIAGAARGNAAPPVLRALARAPEVRAMQTKRGRGPIERRLFPRGERRRWGALAIAALDAGDLDAGTTWAWRSLAEAPDRPGPLGLRVRLGEALLDQGQDAPAITMLADALASARARLPPTHGLRARAAAGLARALIRARDIEGALTHLDREIAAAEVRTAGVIGALLPPFAKVLVLHGASSEAEMILRSTLGMTGPEGVDAVGASLKSKKIDVACGPWLSRLGATPTVELRGRERCAVLQALGETLLDEGRHDDAEPPLREALRGLEVALGAEHPALRPVLQALSEARAAGGYLSESAELGRRASDIAAVASGPPAPDSSVSRPAGPITNRCQIEALFAQEAPALRAWLRGRGGVSREQADDIVQNVFARAIAALERGIIIRDAKAWLMTVARNVLLDDRRRGALVPHETPGPLHAVLDTLTTDEQQLMNSYLSGESPEQMAAVLQISPNAVRQRLYRTRRKLRKALEQPE